MKGDLHYKTLGQFIYVIRKRIKLSLEQAIFIFVNGNIPSNTSLMCDYMNTIKMRTGSCV